MSKLYWIETWGCQMNEHDSEKMAGTLLGLGYDQATRLQDADIILLNTCAIREKAEERVYSTLSQLEHLKKARPETIIGVTGCVAQMSGEQVRERMPFVDLVIGPRASSRLPDILGKLKDHRGIVDTTLYQDSIIRGQDAIRRAPGKVKAFVTIMEGCNKTCSYCIVPTTRGREDSRPLEDILKEVESLVEQGYREIEFLGQNVNAYRDPKTHDGLDILLYRAGEFAALDRIRFTTSHPLHLSTKIIEAMSRVKAACNYLHLPVQSGSDRILRLMRRGYTARKFRDKVAEIREAIPEIALSTDVIVGFPGESEEDYQATLDLLEELRFSQLFSFVYSKRPGTSAATMMDEDEDKTKVSRLMALQAAQREIQADIHRTMLGRTVEVLIEGPSRKDPREVAGRMPQNIMVNFPGEGLRPGDLARVLLTDATPVSFRGRLIRGPLERRIPARSRNARSAFGA